MLFSCVVLLLVGAHARRFSFNTKPCIPEGEKSFLAIGQDYYSILNYSEAIDMPPHGVMGYISLKLLNGTIAGLEEPTNYGSGVEWVAGIAQRYSYSFLQLGVYMVDACNDVSTGQYDDGIDQLAEFISHLEVPVYLRLGYEFDTSINHYDPEAYISAFQYISRRLRFLAGNAALVWHASGELPRDNLQLRDWYPGDEYVDWCGVSVFQQPYRCGEPYECIMESVEDVVRFCGRRHKPVMIAESTPYGGIIDRHSSNAAENINGAGITGVTWNHWFIPVLQLIARHDIKLWSYINCDWDAQPMWRKEVAKGQHWGDTRVQMFPETNRRWISEVVQSPRFYWLPDPATYFSPTCDSLPPPKNLHSIDSSGWATVGLIVGVSAVIGYVAHGWWVKMDNRRYISLPT